jgi:two-component system, LytTR family, response regulator LytT
MEKKVQILLVEDELIIADYMQECLEKLGYAVCGTCINYQEAIGALTKFLPDVVLVDITLKGTKSGIDVGSYIKQHYSIPFIFVTSHSDKSTIDKAKQTLPHAYLIKPFTEDDLYAVIETALMHYGRQKQKEISSEESAIIINDGIFVKSKGKFVKIELSEMLFAEGNDNYVTITTSSTNHVLKTTLKSLLEVLPDNFWRIHRSYVVNLKALKSFDADTVTIANINLPLGKSFYSLLIEKVKIVQG